jgi:hypothetical protein
VVGLIFNIEAVLASIEGGTTKSPWSPYSTLRKRTSAHSAFRSSSGSLAIFTAMRRVSSRVSASEPLRMILYLYGHGADTVTRP